MQLPFPVIDYRNKNILINSDFAINQRGYDPQPADVTLAAGEFPADRWAAGAAGLAVFKYQTWAPTLTGDLVQMVEEGQINGKTVTLSVAGNSGMVGSINGVVGQLPLTVDLNGVQGHIPIMIRLAGQALTVPRVKLEFGRKATAYEAPDKHELSRCWRYYFTSTVSSLHLNSLLGDSLGTRALCMMRPVAMRVPPMESGTMATGVLDFEGTELLARFYASGYAAGLVFVHGYIADAEIALTI